MKSNHEDTKGTKVFSFLSSYSSCLRGCFSEKSNSIKGRSQFLGRDHSPGLAQMRGEFIIRNMIQVNSDPSAHADVRRFEELLRLCFDQHGLNAERRRTPDGDAPVVVMIIGEHCEDFLADEESRFAM